MFNRKLRPGQQGTKKLVEQYGDRLLNVRYIYDSEKQVRLKTAEILVEEKPWRKKGGKIPYNKIMHLRIEYGEVAIGHLVKSAGGRWNKEGRYWELPYREVVSLGLDKRIINS
jgi:hypothetical protein